MPHRHHRTGVRLLRSLLAPFVLQSPFLDSFSASPLPRHVPGLRGVSENASSLVYHPFGIKVRPGRPDPLR